MFNNKDVSSSAEILAEVRKLREELAALKGLAPDGKPEQLVTLDQIAGIVSRSKETIRSYVPRMPGRRSRGRRGAPGLWAWHEVRPFLVVQFSLPRLPERFPSLSPPSENS